MIRLASGSPRRRELLALLGAPFEVVPADVDERAADKPALAKDAAVAPRGVVTLAADTLIELAGERSGKPADATGARTVRARLSGRTHALRTCDALLAEHGESLRIRLLAA